MSESQHLTTAELEAGLEHIRKSPQAVGKLELIVARPAENDRRVLSQGELDVAEGLIGDCWKSSSAARARDGQPDYESQINIMNARAIALIAQSKERWSLAGDQLYADFDLSEANAPPGTQLQIGEAMLEITPPPHLGCKKFTQRFGLAAMKFVNSEVGKELHLRGVNARILRPGVIRVGDRVEKIDRE